MHLRNVALFLSIITIAGCTRSAQPSQSPDASELLRAIPAVTDDRYRTMQDLKGWRNPYLIVRADGIGLLDVSSHEEHRLKLEELPDALANLPASAWPYGRVIAVQETSAVGSSADKAQIRENRAKVAATLHALEIAINYAPSA